MSDEEPVIAYSVKDLLERMDRKLDGFMGAMVSKADRADLDHVRDRLDRHDSQIAGLERTRYASNTLRENWKFVITTAIALMAMAGTVLVVFLH